MTPVITLTTDFGTTDAYVASMKGVILSINPKAVIVDICHSVQPQNILQAAFILSTTHRYFPEGTIHVAVVDPGVGSQRQSIVLKTPQAFFVAPDNGILSYVVNELQPLSGGSLTEALPQSTIIRQLMPGIEAVTLMNPDFWHHPVSSTFHGRDIFAPVAAHLSLGTPLRSLGDSISSIHVYPIPRPYRDAEGNLIGHVLHIDNFGNLITSFKSNDLPDNKVTVIICNQHINELSKFYAEKTGLAAIIGSSGYLEISLQNGNAAAFLKAKVGDEVRVKQIITPFDAAK